MQQYLKTNFLSLLSAFILFVGVPLAYAWTAPTSTPPNGNTKAPITVSLTEQTKEGKLGLGGLAVFGQSLMNKSATSSYTLSTASRQSLTLGVNGKVGAEEYCDKDGLNCVTTLGLLSGGGMGTTTGTSTATSTLPAGGIQVRMGPMGCNYILTTNATCKTQGWENCGGEGCYSRYFACNGGGGGNVSLTCPTVPVNLIVKAAPAIGSSLSVGYSPGTVYRLGNLNIDWTGDNIPSGAPIKLQILNSGGTEVYKYAGDGSGATSKTVPLTDLTKFTQNGVYKVVASTVVDGKALSATSQNFTTINPTAEFSLTGDPTITAVNNPTTGITTKIIATYPMKVKVTGGLLTKPVIGDFVAKFDNASTSFPEVDDTTAVLKATFPAGATLGEGNHQFTIESSYNVPAATAAKPTSGEWKGMIKTIKSKFGTIPAETLPYTNIITTNSATVKGKF
ncbi:MAG: hypothetical protein KBB54_02100 [Candidatus Pacebacteria bacterium]|nr:hypothetical protein [Candidatus Paceibacterota bacterium]MBP9818463.1 hypothetical protein [Candidatus Paceibacterota bacterium]